MQDLRLPQTARRITGWANVIALGGLAMTAIVFADNNNWAASGVVALLLTVAVYLLGTAAYRLRIRTAGRVEVHSMLRLRQLDVANDFTVHRGRLNPAIVILKVGKKRYRLNRGLGGPAVIDEWLRAATAVSVS